MTNADFSDGTLDVYKRQHRYHTHRDDDTSLIQGLAQRCNSQDKDDKQVADVYKRQR